MAYSVAENYASALLHHLGDVANGNDPGKKITPPGFLRSLNENNFAGTVINEGYEENGHIRNARISYMPRFPESLVGTTESCDPDIVPWYNEITTDITKYVELGIYIDDRTIARYVEAASRTVNVGAPAAPGVMQEHLDAVKNAANALFTKMNRILLAKQELAWGTNVANATTTKTVNFNDDTNVNLFTEGLGEILDDYQLNEGQGTPIIVGGGLFNKYVMQQKAKGIAQNGINTAGFEADTNTTTTLFPKRNGEQMKSEYSSLAQSSLSFRTINTKVRSQGISRLHSTSPSIFRFRIFPATHSVSSLLMQS